MAAASARPGPSMVLEFFSLREIKIHRLGVGRNSDPHQQVRFKKAWSQTEKLAFSSLIRELNRQKIRYLIIGRRAVILYGGPVLTADIDLLIHPEDKKTALSLLTDKLGLEISHPPDTWNQICSC